MLRSWAVSQKLGWESEIMKVKGLRGSKAAGQGDYRANKGWMKKSTKGLIQENRVVTKLLDWCSPWHWLEFVLFPCWLARAGAALGLGVPQLTVKPFSDSEREGLLPP